MKYSRRKFLANSAKWGAASYCVPLIFTSCGPSGNQDTTASATSDSEIEVAKDLFFQISLAQWSLHKMFFDGQLDNLDFASKAKNDFGISAIEYVNQFFKDKAEDQSYLAQMKTRAEDNGVSSLLIMIDGEGNLGDADAKARLQAVENHYKWVEAAQFLGCHSIRVNAGGEGTMEEVAKNATDGLRTLSEFAKDFNINVIVENHGGYSSNAEWLTSVISNTEMENCGTLPDFGNFCIKGSPIPGENGINCEEPYDRYKGVEMLMPLAKGVSAKSNVFDEQGNEVYMDYPRLLKIVKDAGYTGYVGIEFEGSTVSEEEGVRKTKDLLMRAGAELS